MPFEIFTMNSKEQQPNGYINPAHLPDEAFNHVIPDEDIVRIQSPVAGFANIIDGLTSNDEDREENSRLSS